MLVGTVYGTVPDRGGLLSPDWNGGDDVKGAVAGVSGSEFTALSCESTIDCCVPTLKSLFCTAVEG